MKNIKKLGIKFLQKDVNTFKIRVWKNQSNKNLLNLTLDKRLNLAPITIYNLDQLGLNHLEIIEFSQCIHKKICTLPAASVDFLNDIESRFKICIGYDKKITGKAHLAKVDHYCSGYNSEGFYPTLSSALFSLDLYI